MEDIALALVFTTAGAGVVAGFVAGIVELVFKPLAPDDWSHGKAPMFAALALSALIVVLALWDAGMPFGPNLIFGFLLMTYTVYAAAVGSHATVRKAVNTVRGTTEPTGPDPH